MPDITEHGFIMLDGLEEWGFRKINGLMEDGRRVIIVAPPAVIETIVAKEFPMLYLSKSVKAMELKSKVEGATVTIIAKDFPETLLKSGKAKELRSKWSE